MSKCTVIILAALLSSCVSLATKYGPSNFSGGFTVVQIMEDVFEITFSGNGYTSSQVVRKYFLYKAAETTVENGGLYFQLLGDRRTKQETEVPRLFINLRGQLDIYPSQTAKYINEGQIRVLKEKPEKGQLYYDAQLILKNVEVDER